MIAYHVYIRSKKVRNREGNKVKDKDIEEERGRGREWEGSSVVVGQEDGGIGWIVRLSLRP